MLLSNYSLFCRYYKTSHVEKNFYFKHTHYAGLGIEIGKTILREILRDVLQMRGNISIAF